MRWYFTHNEALGNNYYGINTRPAYVKFEATPQKRMEYKTGYIRPTERDSATFRDSGIDKTVLSRDKGTSTKSCHGAGRGRILTGCPVPGRPTGEK